LVNVRIEGSWIVVPVGLMAGVQAVVGLGQVLAQRSLGLQGLGEYELDPAWAGVGVVMSDGSRLLRAYGLSDHPNILGGCLAMAALVLAGGSLARSKWRALLGLGFGLALAGLFLTFSRAAALAFAVGFAFLVWSAWRARAQSWRRSLLILIAIGAAVALPLGYLYRNALAGRAGTQNSFQRTFVERRSMEERVALNKAANRIFAEHALTGVGLGALPQVMEDWYPVFGYYYQPAHLVLLDAAAETGLLGAAFYLLAVAAPWLALALRPRRVSLPLIVASSALAAITVISFLDYYPWLLAPGRLMLWSIWGVWAWQYSDLGERSNG
jgi:O-antigen ligase